MKHKWHDEIVAWAGGAEIEVYKYFISNDDVGDDCRACMG
jgi:hypothetical protein